VDSRSDEGSSGCRNVNNNNEYQGCILMNLSTYSDHMVFTFCVCDAAATRGQ